MLASEPNVRFVVLSFVCVLLLLSPSSPLIQIAQVELWVVPRQEGPALWLSDACVLCDVR